MLDQYPKGEPKHYDINDPTPRESVKRKTIEEYTFFQLMDEKMKGEKHV